MFTVAWADINDSEQSKDDIQILAFFPSSSGSFVISMNKSVLIPSHKIF